MINKTYRSVFLQVQPTAIRTADFDHREHVVAPVIMLTEGVLHASNSPNPELVLAEEFSMAPQGWNGRPVVGNHPERGGEPISANSPEVLEAESFGLLFNTHVKGKSLHSEAWIDPRRAEQVGEDAIQVLERLKNMEVVEVSVGAFVAAEEDEGEFNGQRYMSIWREIVPDHLAMLPKGTIGACSVEMGCGSPRAARIYTLSSKGYELIGEESSGDCKCNKEPKQLNEWEKYLEVLKRNREARAFIRVSESEDEEMSDSDLREMLNSALQAQEPGFLGVDAVFMDSQKVVFAADPEGALQFFRRGFSVGENNVITLGDDKEEVRIEQRFVPVNAQSNTNQGEENEMDEAKKARIEALINSKKLGFTADDMEYLGTLSDERLAQLEASVQEPEPTPEPEPEPTPEPEPQAEPGAQTEEEMEAAFMASAPQSIKDMVARAKAEEQKKRDSLVSVLKGAQKAYTEEELRAMGIDDLEKLIQVAGVQPQPVQAAVNFGGMGVPRTADSSEEIGPPPSLADAIAKKRGQ